MWAAMFRAMGIAWRRPLTFKPTVDIDVAFKHLGRPRWKSTLLQVRDVVMGRWPVGGRTQTVLSGQLMDPYDTYAFFNEVHRHDSLRWFVLASDRHLPFDVGLNPDREVLPALVANLASAHEGLQRWGGIQDTLAVDDETVRMRMNIAGFPNGRAWTCPAVRTHFLRGQSHKWWRILESMGIEEDMSLGWARDVGFRSGISRSFSSV